MKRPRELETLSERIEKPSEEIEKPSEEIEILEISRNNPGIANECYESRTNKL